MIDNETTSIVLPARIVEYFEATQTATVQISAEYLSKSASAHSVLNTRAPIKDVPVHTPYGGGWSITFPIKQGDTCLMVFSQIGYDHWLFEDKDVAGQLARKPMPWLDRQFQEDDGFCIVGFNTLPRAIANVTANGSQWRNSDATQHIHLKDGGDIRIETTTNVHIEAPLVSVNCDSAEVIASSNVSIGTPFTNISGDVAIGGKLDVVGDVHSDSAIDAVSTVTAGAMLIGAGLSAGGATIPAGGGSAPATFPNDVEANGISLEHHTHDVTVTGGSSAGTYTSDEAS